MKFLKANWKVLLLALSLILAETFHLLFEGMSFYDEGVNLDDAVYYLVSQICQLTLIPSIIIFLLLPKEKIASLMIAFGLILWNGKEVMDEIFYITGTNSDVFIINLGQFTMLCTLVFLAWLGYTKLK